MFVLGYFEERQKRQLSSTKAVREKKGVRIGKNSIDFLQYEGQS